MTPQRERLREERELCRMIGPRAFRRKRFLRKRDLRPLRVVIRRFIPLDPRWDDKSRIPSSGNVFADLGFEALEAQVMLADTLEKIARQSRPI